MLYVTTKLFGPWGINEWQLVVCVVGRGGILYPLKGGSIPVSISSAGEPYFLTICIIYNVDES